MTAKPVHHYRAFGLSILSPLPLPELDEGASGGDIVIRFDAVEAGRDVRPERECTYATESEACFVWENAGRFLVRDGKEIVIDTAQNASDEAIRQNLMGPVIAMALHQRGFLVLHGSAVATTDRALVFLGGSGYGKSTTAAALNTKGLPTLADDIIAIAVDNSDEPHLIPGLSAANLWPDSAGIFGFGGHSEAGHDGAHRKRAFRTDVFSEQDSFAVGSLYALGVADAVSCETLKPSTGVMELFNHSFGPELLDFGLAGTILERCGKVAVRVPVKRLSRTRSFDQLPELIALIEKDISA